MGPLLIFGSIRNQTNMAASVKSFLNDVFPLPLKTMVRFGGVIVYLLTLSFIFFKGSVPTTVRRPGDSSYFVLHSLPIYIYFIFSSHFRHHLILTLPSAFWIPPVEVPALDQVVEII